MTNRHLIQQYLKSQIKMKFLNSQIILALKVLHGINVDITVKFHS